MIYTIWDVDIYNRESTMWDKQAITISPEAACIECDEHSLDCNKTWMSMLTLNKYGTKWALVVSELDIQLSLEAPFVNQEFRTICFGKGY